MTDTKMMPVYAAQNPVVLNMEHSVPVTALNTGASGDIKKSNFQKYAENTSVGGLTFVLTGSSKIRRILWLLILLACVAGSFYLLRNSVGKLINKPSATTFTTEPNMSLDYPAITICNLNWFSALKVRAASTAVGSDADTVVKTLQRHLRGNCSATYPTTFPASHLPIGLFTDMNPTNFIQSCLINGLRCDIENDFNVTISHNRVCFTFNSGKNGKPLIKANSKGPPGLDLLLDIRSHDYTYTYNNNEGIVVSIHPQDEIPLAGERGINIAPGTSTQITFKKRIVDDQTETHCSPTLSVASCNELVFYSNLRKDCPCFADVRDLEGVEEALNICPLNDLCCFLFHDNFLYQVQELCIPKCKSTQYDIVSTSYATYPAAYSLADFNSSFLDYFRNNYILVEFFYSTLNVETQTTAYYYGIEEFLAEVGGQLGLCIGVSVISLFEFIVFILDEIKDRCCKPVFCCGRR